MADAPRVGVEQRQEFDLPLMGVQITEHRLIARRCGVVTSGRAPAGVDRVVR
jgi:transposase